MLDKVGKRATGQEGAVGSLEPYRVQLIQLISMIFGSHLLEIL